MSKLMELADAYAEALRLQHVYADKTKADEARAAIAAEIERVERDAARYRWLLTAKHEIGIYQRVYGGDCWRVQDTDAAIDAAQEATNGQGN